MAFIDLKQVGLTFHIRPYGRVTFKELFLRRLRNQPLNTITVHALQDIDLRLADGDRLGLVGHNGAGKTTLLRLLAGVYRPTQGQRIVEGKIGSLFEIAVGFEGDASGWENIAYRGYLLGETPKSIRAKRDDIAEFSELGKFLDMPLRYYSSGMVIRLAFSIATAMKPEVLLIDEVLSAGDLSFQQKARQRLDHLSAQARIIVAASHDLDSLGKICSRALWLDRGKVHMAGATTDVVPAYRKAMGQTSLTQTEPAKNPSLLPAA
jgi:ABC-type polysaccharide/polyol phosphate transport system ATPase subunit